MAILAAGLVWAWVLFMIAWICEPLFAWLYMKVLWKRRDEKQGARKVRV